MKRALNIFVFLPMFFPVFLHADTTVTGSILSNTTWTSANGVYTLKGVVAVPANVTLTIEPGTIIKGKSGGSGGLFVYGTLNVTGTADSPVIFTSLLDDAAGGDTNGDATSTSPSVSNWQGLVFQQGSIGNITYAQVTYAGNLPSRSGIQNLGGALELSHVNILNNNLYGIYNKAGTLTVNDSSVSTHQIGIMIESGTSTVSRTSITNNSLEGLRNSVSPDPITLIDNSFSDNASMATISPASDFTHTGNTSSDIANRGFQIEVGRVRNGAVLDSSDLPLIFPGMLTVPAGSTLSIVPGTIIKLGVSAGILVDGDLELVGTKDQAVEMTSLEDDSIGGDTNGDGTAAPLPPYSIPDAWMGVIFDPQSTGHISYVNMYYGGAYAYALYGPAVIYNLGTTISLDHVLVENARREGVYQFAGTTTASHLELAQNPNGVTVAGGSFSINDSSFHNIFEDALHNGGSSLVDARSNWWGSADGPNDTSTTTSTGSGGMIWGNILYTPWLTSVDQESSTSTAATSTDPTIYGNSIPVIVIPGILGSQEKDGVWVMDPILHVYDNLLDTLRANGYEDGLTLFPLPYDWRESNEATAALLKQKINEAKAICNCSKVNIVAHSMGGLAARYYMQSSDYADDVNQIIFIGTPHEGAAEDYLRWEAGAFTGGVINTVSKLYFTHQAKENGYSDIYDYIQNFPIVSVEELLPITDYLHEPGGAYRIYPTGYPRNTFLEDLEAGRATFLASGVKIKNYVGDTGRDTITGIRIVDSTDLPKWADGYPEGFDSFFSPDHGLETGEGDGTVPLSSAELLGTGDIVLNAAHIDLPTAAEEDVVQDLTGTTTVSSVLRSIPERLLIVQVFSPANISVTAPDGKRIGTDPVTGVEVNDIADAFYSGSTAEEEFIAIPDPEEGEYKVDAVGTGSGSYTVRLASVSDDATASTTYTSATEPGKDETKSFALSSDLTIEPVSAPVASGIESSSALPASSVSEEAEVDIPAVMPLLTPVQPTSFSKPATELTGSALSSAEVQPAIPQESDTEPAAPSSNEQASAYEAGSGIAAWWHLAVSWLKNMLVKMWRFVTLSR